MPNRTTERSGLLKLAAYGVGAGVAALVFWIFNRLSRERRREPECRTRALPVQPLSRRPLPTVEPKIGEPAYEPHDANARSVTLVGIGFVIALISIVIVTTLLFFVWTGTGPQLQLPPPGEAISANPPTPLPPPPRLETQPGQVSQPFLASENLILNSYAWVDRSRGIVRIPIDRAMDLIVASGLPARPAVQSQGFIDEGLQIPSGSSSGRAPEELRH